MNSRLGSKGSILLACICVALGGEAGCSLLDDALSTDAPGVCGDATELANVAGQWELRGEAQRTQCADEDWNSDHVKLESNDLSFSQEGDQVTYTGPKDAPGITARVVLAAVDECEVTVSIRETTSEGIVELDFAGIVVGDTITGDLEGEGPGTCRLSGRFSAEIER